MKKIYFFSKKLSYFLLTIISIIIVVEFVLIFIFSFVIIGVIMSPLWIPVVIKRIKEFFEYLIQDHPEEIKGDIVEINERYEPLFISFPTVGFDQTYQWLQNYEPISIHRYILTLKKGVDLITIRIPIHMYRKIKKEMNNGLKNISIICEKNNLDGVYDFYEN